MPPSTVNNEPVAKALSSLARKTMMPSTSAGFRTAQRDSADDRGAGFRIVEIAVTSEVSVYAGTTVFTRMPRWAYAAATVRARPWIPAFEAL